MKKLLIILFSTLSLTISAEDVIIALLQPLTVQGTTACDPFEVSVVRGELRKAFGWQSGYQVVTRLDVDAIMEEMGFQQSGMVNDAQRKEVGNMTGAQYICVSSITKYNTQIYIEAYLVNVETGQMTNPATQYTNVRNGDYSSLPAACTALADEMLGTIRREQERQRQLAEERLAEQRRSAAAERAEQEKINKLKNRHWRELLDSRITKVTYKYNSGWYVGKKDINGLGLYCWFSRDTYFGRWENGDREGIGTYMCLAEGYHIKNCENGTVYVGEWKNSKKHGIGSIYDKNGKLIYYGKFFNNKPTGKYPTQGCTRPEYTFEVVNYNNGKYVGEMKNGKPHGKGMFIWAEGSGIVWYGEWADGKRAGYGIYIYNDGSEFSEGIWKNNTKL